MYSTVDSKRGKSNGLLQNCQLTQKTFREKNLHFYAQRLCNDKNTILITSKIQGQNPGSGFRVRSQGKDSGLGFRVRIQSQDSESGFRVRI